MVIRICIGALDGFGSDNMDGGLQKFTALALVTGPVFLFSGWAKRISAKRTAPSRINIFSSICVPLPNKGRMHEHL
jgi:hypothetical protein